MSKQFISAAWKAVQSKKKKQKSHKAQVDISFQ